MSYMDSDIEISAYFDSSEEEETKGIKTLIDVEINLINQLSGQYLHIGFRDNSLNFEYCLRMPSSFKEIILPPPESMAS